MSDTPCVVVGCGSTPTRRHMNGHLCAEHAPHVPTPPPGTTLADLRAAHAAEVEEREAAQDARRATRMGRTEVPAGDRARTAPAAATGAPTSPLGRALADRARAAAAAAPRREGVDPAPRRDLDAEHAYTPVMPRDTTRAAAAAVLPRSGTQRRKVYDAILDAAGRGYGGATDLELTRATGLGGNSVRPRRLELVEAGLVVDTGHRRTADGTAHIVWGPTPS